MSSDVGECRIAGIKFPRLSTLLYFSKGLNMSQIFGNLLLDNATELLILTKRKPWEERETLVYSWLWGRYLQTAKRHKSKRIDLEP